MGGFSGARRKDFSADLDQFSILCKIILGKLGWGVHPLSVSAPGSSQFHCYTVHDITTEKGVKLSSCAYKRQKIFSLTYQNVR